MQLYHHCFNYCDPEILYYWTSPEGGWGPAYTTQLSAELSVECLIASLNDQCIWFSPKTAAGFYGRAEPGGVNGELFETVKV